MRILFASAEVAPFAKVGGLADVAGSLPLALQARGHEVKVVMPAYQMILDRWSPQRSIDFEVRMNPYWTARATLHEVHAEGLTLWLIEGCGFFSGIGRSEEVYTPGRDAYLFFAQAALEACLATEWTPDIVHAHDWHMGFLPVLMRETRGGRWEGVASCITIHNLAYQGEFGPDTLEVAGLPKSLYNMHALETYGAVNFLKSGCVYADQVNTVSPNYAQEIQTGEYGCRLDGLMGYLYDQGRLRGILNGINVHHHNPATDPDLPVNFSVDDLTGKAASRTQLMEELGLDPDTNAPLLGVVSRLSNQKGFDLMIGAADRILGMGARWIVLGTGDPWSAGELRRLEAQYPGRVRFVEAFDVALAQRIYGGCDIFLMPSAFEPCGLGQMFAMRYGTVPVVRQTGGLADTVKEGETGFVFTERTAEEFGDATARAIAAFRDPDTWQKLVYTCMTQDFSWSSSAQAYEAMYADAVAHRSNARTEHPASVTS